MAKDRKKLLHIHSSIPDKQPTAASLEVGEIAVNNAANQEFLSIKNSDNKIKRFSSDEQIITWMEKKEVMPYEGYTRGSDGPAGATGPDSVTNDDLLQNKSNLIIKLNQVAASNTAKHDKVNGAKDIYGNCVNPTSDSGVTDGAGFAIDMSRYAMIGANPSFSSLTVTDKTDLSGNTTIADGDGTSTRSGHTLTIKTTDVVANDTNWTEAIINKQSTVTNETDNITTFNESATTRNAKVGTETLHVSGTTTETHDKDVTITNNSSVTETTKGNVVENVSGTTTINHSGNTVFNTIGNTTIQSTGAESDVIIYAKDDLCETSDDVAAFKGANKTNVGIDCSDASRTKVTNVYGDTINERANTADTRVDSAYTSATTATTVIGTANTSATTATLSGNTLVVNEATSISAKTPSTTISGTNFTLNETNTTINSCGKVEITTDSFSLNQCSSSGGSAEFEFCNGYTVKSNNIKLQQCGSAGTISISAQTQNIDGGNLKINESGDTAINTNGTTNISAGTITQTTNDATNINVGGNLVEKITGTTTITSTGTTTIEVTGENSNVCISATDSARVYGNGSTYVGVKCDGTIGSATTIEGTTLGLSGNTTNISGATTLNLSGATINEGGTANNNNFTTINNTATTINNKANFNVSGNTYISGNTTISGDATIGGDLIIPIPCNSITSTTVNDALCEVFDRGEVSWKVGDYAATDENLKWYELYQNGEQLKDQNGDPVRIDIPKDHILKDAEVVYGIADDSGFTPCTTSAEDCHWYLKFTWNVYTPSGHTDDKVVYIPADDFIKDIDDSNPTGIVSDSYNNVVVDVWYNGEKNLVSATTTPTIHASQNIYADGNISGTDITAYSAIRGNNVSADTVSAATHVKALEISGTNVYGVAVSGTNLTSAANLTVKGGGADITGETNINGNLTITGTVTASGAIYSSDLNLKENVAYIKQENKAKAANIFFREFNFKDDESKRLTYGVIAQELQNAGLDELVHVKDDGMLGVDYISLLILKLAYTEEFCATLNQKIIDLEEKIDKLENKD